MRCTTKLPGVGALGPLGAMPELLFELLPASTGGGCIGSPYGDIGNGAGIGAWALATPTEPMTAAPASKNLRI